jgi:hypothetical protein
MPLSLTQKEQLNTHVIERKEIITYKWISHHFSLTSLQAQRYGRTRTLEIFIHIEREDNFSSGIWFLSNINFSLLEEYGREEDVQILWILIGKPSHSSPIPSLIRKG